MISGILQDVGALSFCGLLGWQHAVPLSKGLHERAGLHCSSKAAAAAFLDGSASNVTCLPVQENPCQESEKTQEEERRKAGVSEISDPYPPACSPDMGLVCSSGTDRVHTMAYT